MNIKRKQEELNRKLEQIEKKKAEMFMQFINRPENVKMKKKFVLEQIAGAAARTAWIKIQKISGSSPFTSSILQLRF